MSIQDRIAMIIKANNLSPSQFADRIGVQRSNLSHVLNGRNKPGLDFLKKILTEFPKVNASWLITGESREEATSADPGKVYRTASQKQADEKKYMAKRTKSIERIVVFYEDGSFSEYNPDH